MSFGLLFSEEETGSGAGGEGKRGVGKSGRRGTVLRMCCMREEPIFIKNE